MSEVEVTDYETVEKTRTKYKCDHCGVAYEDEDEVTTVFMEKGDFGPTTIYTSEFDEKMHLCEGCIGIREAYDQRIERNEMRERWEGIANKATVWPLWLMVPIGVCAGFIGAFFGGFIEPSVNADPHLVLIEAGLGALFAVFALLMGSMLVYELIGQRDSW